MIGQKENKYCDEHQKKLIKAAQNGCRRSANKIARENMGLVGQALKIYLGRVSADDYNDLMQGGQLGLAEAIHKFDVTKGVRFSTYAVRAIQSNMRDAYMICIGVKHTAYNHARAIRQYVSQHTVDNKKRPSLEEIADGTNLRLLQIRGAIKSHEIGKPASLNRTLQDSKSDIQVLDIIESNYNDQEFDVFREELNTLYQKGYLTKKQAYFFFLYHLLKYSYKDISYFEEERYRHVGKIVKEAYKALGDYQGSQESDYFQVRDGLTAIALNRSCSQKYLDFLFWRYIQFSYQSTGETEGPLYEEVLRILSELILGYHLTKNYKNFALKENLKFSDEAIPSLSVIFAKYSQEKEVGTKKIITWPLSQITEEQLSFFHVQSTPFKKKRKRKRSASKEDLTEFCRQLYLKV